MTVAIHVMAVKLTVWRHIFGFGFGFGGMRIRMI
jgi:hypothetical protein